MFFLHLVPRGRCISLAPFNPASVVIVFYCITTVGKIARQYYNVPYDDNVWSVNGRRALYRSDLLSTRPDKSARPVVRLRPERKTDEIIPIS